MGTMTDAEAFFAECLKPYVPEFDNCATAVAAAFPHWDRMHKYVEHWRSEPLVLRLADHANVKGWASAAAWYLRAWRTEPDGYAPAWGVANVAGQDVIAVKLQGRWWARSPRGAMQLPASRVVRAWEAETCLRS